MTALDQPISLETGISPGLFQLRGENPRIKIEQASKYRVRRIRVDLHLCATRSGVLVVLISASIATCKPVASAFLPVITITIKPGGHITQMR